MNPSTAVPASGIAPLNIGVAGLGKMGVFHLERLGLREDCRVVAVHDHCPQAANRLPPGDVRFCAEWRELIQHPEVELVLLATPPAAHAIQAVSALRAGKHVAVETPLCLAPEEADAVLAAEHDSGRVVTVIDTRRWDDDFLAAKAALAEEALGSPRSIRYINWHFSPLRVNPERTMNAACAARHGAPPSCSPWRDDRATGGGVLWEFGTSLFGQLLQLTDEQPVEVFARITPAPDCPAIDEAFLAVVTFERGLTAAIDVNRASPAPISTGWVIAGTAGSYAGFTQFVSTPEGEIVDVPQSFQTMADDEYYGALVRRIRRNESNPISAAEARRSLVLIAAARKSAACGRPVPIEL